MRTRTTLICSLALALITASATAESVYVVNIAAQFGTVDLSTGAFTQIGSGLPESGASLVAGPGGSLLTIGNSGELYSINPSTGVATSIGSTGLDGSSPGNFANSIIGFNGAFYATDMNNTFYSLNPTTGATTLIGSTGMPGDPGCGAYPNLCDEALFDYNGNLYAIYDAFIVGPDGYTNPVTVNPALWQIDPITGAATFISSADLHILALTEISGELLGFQGFPSSTNPLPNALIEAVSFDLSNGHTSEIVSLGTDIAPISGIAPDIAPTPEPASLALLGTSLAAIAVRLRSIKLRP